MQINWEITFNQSRANHHGNKTRMNHGRRQKSHRTHLSQSGSQEANYLRSRVPSRVLSFSLSLRLHHGGVSSALPSPNPSVLCPVVTKGQRLRRLSQDVAQPYRWSLRTPHCVEERNETDFFLLRASHVARTRHHGPTDVLQLRHVRGSTGSRSRDFCSTGVRKLWHVRATFVARTISFCGTDEILFCQLRGPTSEWECTCDAQGNWLISADSVFLVGLVWMVGLVQQHKTCLQDSRSMHFPATRHRPLVLGV